MGDHRLSVEMTLVGHDGKERRSAVWLNWHPDQPQAVMDALMNLAEASGLQANWPDQFYIKK